jgi:hypothetical protein
MIWEFRWSAAPGADRYHLMVSGPMALLPTINDANLASTSYRLRDKAFIAERDRLNWRWKVRAQVKGEWTDWSEERTFHVAPLAKAPPIQPSEPPKPLAHYRFRGNANDEDKANPPFALNNTSFKDNALYLNGVYGMSKDPNGYRAVGRTPKLDYTTFTVALRFKAESFDGKKYNLLTGGTLYRWFGLSRSFRGLHVTLNNQRFRHEVKEARIEQGKWTVLVCGMDVARRKGVVYLNGVKIEELTLPEGLALEVIGSPAEDSDKVWTFTNYSNGSTFHGLVSELIIYGKLLSPAEVAAIPLSP